MHKLGYSQRCQVVWFVHNYYAHMANITVLWVAVKNFRFLILKFCKFFFDLIRKFEHCMNENCDIFDNKFLTMLPNNCF